MKSVLFCTGTVTSQTQVLFTVQESPFMVGVTWNDIGDTFLFEHFCKDCTTKGLNIMQIIQFVVHSKNI